MFPEVPSKNEQTQTLPPMASSLKQATVENMNLQTYEVMFGNP
jgi:hypothetical protein